MAVIGEDGVVIIPIHVYEKYSKLFEQVKPIDSIDGCPRYSRDDRARLYDLAARMHAESESFFREHPTMMRAMGGRIVSDTPTEMEDE